MPDQNEEGLQFPKDAEGKRSTMPINQATFAAAVAAIDSNAAQAVRAEKKWRFGYRKHVVKQVELSCKEPKAALQVAEAGLRYVHDKFTFVRNGTETSLAEAMTKYTSPKFDTYRVNGTGKLGPYNIKYKGKTLTGPELAQQVERWSKQGVIEVSAANALLRVADKPKWADLSSRYFVLFGAGSAMGPYEILMGLGANVIALDLPFPAIWERLFKIAAASPGNLIAPVDKAGGAPSNSADAAKTAGCDLLKFTPEVRTWLLELVPKEPLVLGGYCYLDGPLFVRVALAMDAIMSECIKKRQQKPAVAFLCTPTDAHVTTDTCRTAAQLNLRRAPLWQQLFAALLCGKRRMVKNARRPVPTADGKSLSIVDAIIPEQGPNYCLAKRLQHWRAMLARADGCIASSNVAPSTATVSVTKRRSFALAYEGMPSFSPIEIFAPETSNTVMTGLLLADLNDPVAAANPNTELHNPLCLFAENAVHGGAYRCAYRMDSLAVPALTKALAGRFGNMYLVAYSLLQVYLLVSGLIGLSAPGANWWEKGLQIGVLSQQLSVLEVAHALLGLTPSSLFLVFAQIMSRLIVMAAGLVTPQAHTTDMMGVLLAAWGVADLIRNLFYVAKFTTGELYPIVWLRYTLFIVLYPVGVGAELYLMRQAVDLPASAFAKVTDFAAFGFGAQIQNAQQQITGFVNSYWWTPIFKYVGSGQTAFIFLLVLWLPGLAVLYSTMLAARRKRLK